MNSLVCTEIPKLHGALGCPHITPGAPPEVSAKTLKYNSRQGVQKNSPGPRLELYLEGPNAKQVLIKIRVPLYTPRRIQSVLQDTQEVAYNFAENNNAIKRFGGILFSGAAGKGCQKRNRSLVSPPLVRVMCLRVEAVAMF